MHAESVRMRASAAKHWCMHEVFIKSGFFLRITACVEVISRSPTWPSVQAGCPVWQLEIISFISHFALIWHTYLQKTQTSIHTHQRQRHQAQLWLHTHAFVLSISPLLYLFFNSEPDLHPSYHPSIPASVQTLGWGFTSRSCAQNVF